MVHAVLYKRKRRYGRRYRRKGRRRSFSRRRRSYKGVRAMVNRIAEKKYIEWTWDDNAGITPSNPATWDTANTAYSIGGIKNV